MRLETVARDAHHLAVGFLEVGIEIAELLRLGSATRRIVLRIKIDDQMLAASGRQAEGLVARGG